MFTKGNEIALAVHNATIWRLYNTGEYRAAKIIEKERDKEAMVEYDRKVAAKAEREKVYLRIHKIYKEGKRFATNPIPEIKKEKYLGKVFFLMVKSCIKLRTFTKPGELYNSVSCAYLQTYTDWREGDSVSRNDLYEFRLTLDNVGRAIRHVKADHPELFNVSLLTKSQSLEADAVETFGNDGLL